MTTATSYSRCSTRAALVMLGTAIAIMTLAMAPAHADLSATCAGIEVSSTINSYEDAMAAIKECAADMDGSKEPPKVKILMGIEEFMALSSNYIPELTQYYSLARIGNGDATAGFFTKLCAGNEDILCKIASSSNTDETTPAVAPRAVGGVSPRVRGSSRKLAQVTRTTLMPRVASSTTSESSSSNTDNTEITVYADANQIQQDFAAIMNGGKRLRADTTFELESTADNLAITMDAMLEG